MTLSVIPETTLAPVSCTERIESLDIIRALALFGVILMNLPQLGGNSYLPGHAGSQGTWEAWGWGISKSFLSSKAMANFSMLFAMGLFIQFERAARRGMGTTIFAVRRLSGLLLIGLTHFVLIFDKDILVTYALLGLVLASLVKAKPRTLILVGVCGMAISESLPLLIKWFHLNPGWSTQTWMEGNATAHHQIYGLSGSWLEAATHRFQALGRGSYGAYTLESLGYMLPMFMTGAFLWRRGMARDPGAHLPALTRLFHGTFWVGLALNFALRLPLHLIPTAWRQAADGVPLIVVSDISIYALALGYFSGLLLLLRHGHWRKRLSFVAPMGRMALTNYLAHSLLLSWLFYHHGLGLWGKAGFRTHLVLSVALYACQCSWSSWWLARFKFGPAEWLWRSMTYRQWQPFRIPVESRDDLPAVTSEVS